MHLDELSLCRTSASVRIAITGNPDFEAPRRDRWAYFPVVPFPSHGTGFEGFHALSARHEFSSQHGGVFCSRVARRTQDADLAEARGFELFEEGAAFLCARDSRKPIVLARLDFRRQRFSKYQFGAVDLSTRAKTPGQLAEDRFSGWVEVEDTVDDG